MYHLPTGHTCTQRILSTGRIRPQYNTRNPQTGLDKYMVLWYSEKAFISAKNVKDIIDIIFFLQWTGCYTDINCAGCTIPSLLHCLCNLKDVGCMWKNAPHTPDWYLETKLIFTETRTLVPTPDSLSVCSECLTTSATVEQSPSSMLFSDLRVRLHELYNRPKKVALVRF